MTNTEMFDKIISYIREEFKKNAGFIPLHEPLFQGNEKKYINEAIESTFVSSIGTFVDRFEDMIAEIAQSKRGVAIVNGTSALHLALRLSGVSKETEVITQALTFVATPNAISYLGAYPVFLDVDRNTMGLSPDALLAFLDEFGELRDDGTYNKKTGRKISACVPMHTFGFPCDIISIVNICKKRKIPVIEDAAESLGSYYRGKHTGGFGTMGIFSLNGNKIITSGGGGAIVTNYDSLADLGKHLSTTAKKSHPWDYYHDYLGYNYRMPNINAALACAQIENLDYFLNKKRDLAGRYDQFFNSLGIKFRKESKDSKANYWLMAIELENKKERDQFLKKTNQSMIMTRPIWTLMNKLPFYKQCIHDDLKESLYLEDRIVNIPSSVISD